MQLFSGGHHNYKRPFLSLGACEGFVQDTNYDNDHSSTTHHKAKVVLPQFGGGEQKAASHNCTLGVSPPVQ